MARTRSKPAPKSKANETTPEPSTSTAKALPESTSNPPKLFVLPKNTSKDARIITLDNPATDAPSRYYFCPQKGFYEFTRIAAPKKDCRSWLITGEKDAGSKKIENDAGSGIGSGHITKSADIFVATPIDLLFLILPALAPKSAKDTKQHFLELDDYVDKMAASSSHWRALVSQYPTLKSMIEKKVRIISDTVDAGDQTMYRISNTKLLDRLLKKAERMVASGLPPSLEEKFIKTALDVPVMNIRREDSSLSGVENTSASTPSIEADSQTTTSSTSESQVSVETNLTIPSEEPTSTPTPALTTPPEIPRLLRLRTSLNYLIASYIPSTLHAPLRTLLTSHPTHSFATLDTHLSALSKLRLEAAALRSISDNISRKRAYEEDEDKIAEREEKKRKKEEEEKKKKAEGRGVKQLKKVDTSGMKKMSSFFTKVAKKT